MNQHTSMRSQAGWAGLGPALLLLLALSGCGADGGPDAGPTQTSVSPAATSPEATESPMPDQPNQTDLPEGTRIPLPTTDPEPSLPTGGVTDQIRERAEVQEAVADFAKRRDVPTSEIEVVGYAEVTWRDGSLGCPQPGMNYTQALVPGAQLVLQHGESLASYHAATDKPFRYCANPMPPPPGANPTE